jgi:hypothetical protein
MDSQFTVSEAVGNVVCCLGRSWSPPTNSTLPGYALERISSKQHHRITAKHEVGASTVAWTRLYILERQIILIVECGKSRLSFDSSVPHVSEVFAAMKAERS